MKKWIGMLTAVIVPVALLVPGVAGASSIALDDFLTINNDNAGSAIFRGFCVIGPPNSGTDAELIDIMVGMTFDVGANKAYFEFVNRSSISANIAEIYFDDQDADPAYLGGGWVENSLGTVGLTIGSASPGNLSGGNSLTPKFTANPDLSADNGNVNTNGVNTGENVVLGFNVYDWTALADALYPSGTDVGLRIGLHIRSIGGGENSPSDAFYSCTDDLPIPPETNTNNPVPEPSTIVLLSLGSSFLLMRKRLAWS